CFALPHAGDGSRASEQVGPLPEIRALPKVDRTRFTTVTLIFTLLPLRPSLTRRRSIMRRVATFIAAVACALSAMAAHRSPARADWCLSLSAGAFGSGAFPFTWGTPVYVHIKGTMPRGPGQMKPVVGRIDGTNGGPLFGTALVHGDGSQLEIGAKFFLDAE